MSEQGVILMPAMGEGIIEAKLVRWLKQPGDTVAKDEPFVEVATDKVDSEIPAPLAGVLIEHFAREGESVAINAPLARISAGEGRSAAASSVVAAPAGGSTVMKPAEKGQFAPLSHQPSLPLSEDSLQDRLRSSPLVKKIARENQVDLRSVTGSGSAGRITRQDIEGFLSGRGTEAPLAAGPGNTRGAESGPQAAVPPSLDHLGVGNARGVGSASPVGVHSHEPARLKTQVAGDQEFLEGVRVRREKMSNMRQIIAEHMERSVRTSPHVTTTFEIDLHRVTVIREAEKDAFARREGFSLTYTSFFVYAAALAIKKHPIVNVSVDGSDILHKTDINVGVAVSLGDQGLIVPVIKNAGELNLLGIARRLNDVVARARSKRLLPDDVKGGTFSITNPGGYGSLHSNPIISQPQVAMMSVGCIVKRPVVLPGDLIGIRPMMIMGLTFDHRVIDGEQGARFLATVKDILENFTETPA